MTVRWQKAWGLAAIAFGGASLIVPLYVVELGGDAAILGLLFAVASFVGVPGALIFGNLADRTGKRRVFVLAAMVVTFFAMIAIPLLESIPLVIGANAALWLAFAAAIPVLNLLAVADEPPDRWSAMIARLNKFQGFGWALGLAIGFVVTSVGTQLTDPITAQRAFFLTCAIAVGIALILAARTLPADPSPGDEPSRRRLERAFQRASRFSVRGASFPFTPSRFDPRNLHHRRLVERFTPRLSVYFLAVVLFFAGFGIFFAVLPAYLAGLGYGAGGIFGLYLVLNAAAAVFFDRAATLAKQYNLKRLHASGLLVRGVGLPLIVVIGAVLGVSVLGIAATAVVFFVIGLTWAVIAVTGATIVTTLAPPMIRGEALGLYGGLGALGGGIGGLVGGALASLDYLIAFGVAGGIVVVSAAIVIAIAAPAATAATEEPDTAGEIRIR